VGRVLRRRISRECGRGKGEETKPNSSVFPLPPKLLWWVYGFKSTLKKKKKKVKSSSITCPVSAVPFDTLL